MRIHVRLPFTGDPIEIHFSKLNLIPIVLMVMLPLIPVGDSLFLPLQGAWDVWKQFTAMFGISAEAIGGSIGLILLIDGLASVLIGRVRVAPAARQDRVAAR